MPQIKVLLCSPKGIPGGISQWTENILDYSINDESVSLNWFYPTLKANKLVPNLSFLHRFFKGIKNYIPFIRNLKEHLKSNQYDVAHFSTSGSVSFLRDYYALKACKKHGIKTVLHLHFGRIPQVLTQRSFEKKLFDRLIKYTDTFIAIDNQTFNALKEYGLNNVYNLPNPLAPRIESLISAMPDVDREPNKILFVGHVLKTKGIYELTKACSEIGNVKLEILGLYDDIVKSDVLSQIPENYHSSINFRGNCCINDVIKAMKNCTAFILPSYTEGFPNVIIESMACACPIVATSVGAIPDMLNIYGVNPCGLIVPARDVNALKKAICKILIDPEISNMGTFAKERVNKLYSINNIWKELKAIWHQ